MEQHSKAGRLEEHMTRYAVVFEDAGQNWAAYVPDLPGCIATGETLEDCKREITSAMRFHLEGLRQDGLEIPPASSVADYIAA